MSSIPFHPIANLFPLMEGEEFDALVADIEKNGQREPIVLYQGKILDGRNRYRACLAAGIGLKLPKHEDNSPYIGDPVAYVISKNVHRRHLTAEQKRDLIARLLKADPSKSDRQIAETVKASPTTVGTVRREVEPTVQSGQLRVGKDGKARKQPARKKQAQRELEANQAHIDELESAREHDKDLAEQLRAAEIKIVGLEGKLEDLKAERDWLRERVAELEAALAGSGAAKAEKPKRGRGRPKGSKNKPKTTQAEAT
jgi:ParB-like nuclease domain